MCSLGLWSINKRKNPDMLFRIFEKNFFEIYNTKNRMHSYGRKLLRKKIFEVPWSGYEPKMTVDTLR